MSVLTTPAAAPNKAPLDIPKRRAAPPGDPGLWMFITADTIMFGVFFFVFMHERWSQAALFERSRRLLDPNIGLLNSFFLLTSSWLVVRAVHLIREHRQKAASRFLVLGIICGFAFVVTKFLEYLIKIKAGITIFTNDFFMLYFVFTGVHFFHVIGGLGVLGFVLFKMQQRPQDKTLLIWVESGASYWHMVDLLWLVLFPLLYLLNAS